MKDREKNEKKTEMDHREDETKNAAAANDAVVQGSGWIEISNIICKKSHSRDYDGL